MMHRKRERELHGAETYGKNLPLAAVDVHVVFILLSVLLFSLLCVLSLSLRFVTLTSTDRPRHLSFGSTLFPLRELPTGMDLDLARKFPFGHPSPILAS